MNAHSLGARATAEALGSAFLLAAVVGSGIMGERLSAGNAAVALLANTAATGAALFVLITTLAPISGAHFHPLVTLGATLRRALAARDGAVYIVAQLAGALLGVACANAMFGAAVFEASTKLRDGSGRWLGEFVATFGLIAAIELSSRHTPSRTALVVAAYISAAYWFTSSTSFANPTVTLARATTDSFAGIAPSSVPGFVVAQCLGWGAASLLLRATRTSTP
ncbi:MAG: aquaporin family protein [Planctomycetes bacterium]|nr:aquaporin family protein [Planctomycetota bacterium]